MFFRLPRIRLFIVALVAIIITILLAIELFGDDVVRVVTQDRAIQIPKMLREEMNSLDAEAPPEETVQASRTFAKEEPMPLSHKYTKTLVLGKRSIEDTDWLYEELPAFEKAVYMWDNNTANLRIPKNKGNEAMVYLSYIIDHYDSLNDITAFIHSDRWAWHNNDLFDSDTAMMLKSLIPQRVIREGYVNLRCQWYPGCPTWLNTSSTLFDEEKREEPLIRDVWADLFPEDPLPTALAQPCCSQFALSRARIQAIPREEYVRLRNWLIGTRIADNLVGRVFEYIWHYLWTGRSVLCASQHACYCDLYGACFDDDDDFQSWVELRNYVRRAEWEMLAWDEAISTRKKYMQQGKKQLALGVRMPPDWRIDELKADVQRKWIRLLEKREVALRNGRDSRWRARIAGRTIDRGDEESDGMKS
jgi:Protein of unknown function (DUF3431)